VPIAFGFHRTASIPPHRSWIHTPECDWHCGLDFYILWGYISLLEPFPFRPERLSGRVYDSRVGLATKKLFFDVDIC
jgi:hypothetical protein